MITKLMKAKIYLMALYHLTYLPGGDSSPIKKQEIIKISRLPMKELNERWKIAVKNLEGRHLTLTTQHPVPFQRRTVYQTELKTGEIIDSN